MTPNNPSDLFSRHNLAILAYKVEDLTTCDAHLQRIVDDATKDGGFADDAHIGQQRRLRFVLSL